MSNIPGLSVIVEIKVKSGVPVSSVKTASLVHELLDPGSKPRVSFLLKLKSLDGKKLICCTSEILV